MSSEDTVTMASSQFNWIDDNMSAPGIVAQTIDTIDLSAVTITSQPIYSIGTTTGAIGTSAGMNGVWGTTASAGVLGANASTISFTDPYEEMEKRLKRVEEIIAEEQRIRDECPAVKNAYDEYRFLLVLAKQHSTIPPTE